jgi:Domain of unknown function (DUF6285)
MHESPSAAQLLQAVIAFLNDVATPALSGHAQFHARVSANALALVARELVQREAADHHAASLYSALLAQSDPDPSSLSDLEAALCEAIRTGKIDHKTPHLLASLRDVAKAQLAIDQPTYSGLSV